MDESPRSVAEPTSEPQEGGGSVVYDALAELFLGDAETSDDQDDNANAEPPAGHEVSPSPGQSEAPRSETARQWAPAQSPHAPAEPSRTPVELLVLGHLPVYAGPWAAQYAGAVAGSDQAPAALVRLLDGQISVDLIGADGHGADLPICATLDEALAAASRIASRWLVRLDPVSEATIATREEIDVITVLTGADEAATVAAYRAVKGIAEVERLARRAPQVQVAIMGAEGDAADAAWARLGRAVRSFLETPLSRAPGVARMGPVASRTLFRGEACSTSEELVETLGVWSRPSSTRMERVDADVAAPASPTGGGGHVVGDDAGRGRGEAPRGAAPVAAAEGERAEQRGADGPMDGANAPPRAERSQDHRGAPDLAGLVGLSALRARCPRDEAVELAVDDQGRLHLVAADGPSAVERLLDVAGWARAHAALLSAAESAVRDAGAPTMHLLTGDPARASGLLDSGVRLHLRVSEQDVRRGSLCLN